MDLIAKATPEELRAVIEPRLNEKTFDGIEDIDAFFQSCHDALSSGVHLTHTNKTLNAMFKGHANLAKKMSHGRLFIFKDDTAWMDYNDIFGGTGSLTESMLRSLESSAGRTAIMRKLGTNPESMIDSIYNKLFKVSNGKNRKKLAQSQGHTNDLMAVVTGETMQAGNQMFAARMSGLRAWINMSYLGRIILSSIGTDNVVHASEVRYQGSNMFSGLLESIGSAFSGRGSLSQREEAANLGVAMDSFVGSLASKFTINEPVSGMTQKSVILFFKANLLSWWDDSLRVGAAIGTSHRLYQLKHLPYTKLDSRVQRVIKLYGITEPEWNIIRQGYKVDEKGVGLLTPEAQKKIPDSEFVNLLEAKGVTANKTSIRDARVSMERKLRNYVSDRNGFAVLQTDTKTQAFLTNGTKRGTYGGELLRSIAHFKAYPTAFFQRVLGREVHGKMKGSLPDAKLLDSPLYGVASLMTALTVAGYVSNSAHALASGKTPPSFNDNMENNFSIVKSAALKGMGLGIYGDMLFGDLNHFNRNFSETAAGPEAGLIGDFVGLYQKIRDGDDVGANAAKLVLHNTPFLNLFYSRIVLDYLFLYDIRESLNPGYLKRTEYRVRKLNNQEYMYPPSEYALRPFTGQ
jgi:hypothetical protein